MENCVLWLFLNETNSSQSLLEVLTEILLKFWGFVWICSVGHGGKWKNYTCSEYNSGR